ncbi:MAG: TVP38/TMEM64 family protein [Dokdonella sp.]
MRRQSLSGNNVAANNSKKGGFPWKWVVFAVILIGITAAWLLLPVNEWITQLKSWVDGMGAWGYVIFGLIYIAATIVLAPGAPLTIAAGLIFGGWGIPLVIAAATIGACLAFLIARHLARDRVKKAIDSRPKFKAVSDVVGEDGWKIVGLMRLSPAVPFNLQNYFFGVTEVKFWHYALATFFGIMPGSSLYVYLGVIGGEAGGGSGSTLKWVLLGAGLVATIIVTVLVTKKANEKLKNEGVSDKPKSKK